MSLCHNRRDCQFAEDRGSVTESSPDYALRHIRESFPSSLNMGNGFRVMKGRELDLEGVFKKGTRLAPIMPECRPMELPNGLGNWPYGLREKVRHHQMDSRSAAKGNKSKSLLSVNGVADEEVHREIVGIVEISCERACIRHAANNNFPSPEAVEPDIEWGVAARLMGSSFRTWLQSEG